MKRYALLLGGLTALLLILFLLIEALDVPLLTGPRPWLRSLGPLAALGGVGLLIGDVLLPVPSSLVMVAHGALFGVVTGAALSLVGSVGAAVFGFALGRRSAPIVARLVTKAERRRVDSLLARWGDLVVLVSRPIPIVAEVVAIAAGASSMRWPRLFVASAVGSAPASLLYSLAGATATSPRSGALVFALVLTISGIIWIYRKN